MHMDHSTDGSGSINITDIHGRLGTVLDEQIVKRLNDAHTKLGNTPPGTFQVCPEPKPPVSRYEPQGPASTVRFQPDPSYSFEFTNRHGGKNAYVLLVDTIAAVLGPQSYEGGFVTLDESSYGVTKGGHPWIAYNANTGMIYDGPNDYVGMHSE